jgi:hypothetical protein
VSIGVGMGAAAILMQFINLALSTSILPRSYICRRTSLKRMICPWSVHSTMTGVRRNRLVLPGLSNAADHMTSKPDPPTAGPARW